MTNLIGQYVRHVKVRTKCSLQNRTACPTIAGMQTASHKAIKAEICSRTRALRKARDLSQEQVALVLDVTKEAYAKYENRTPMPHYLLERFAVLVGSDVQFIITGKSAKSA